MSRGKKFRAQRRIPDTERSLFEQKLSGRYSRTLDRTDLLNLIRGETVTEHSEAAGAAREAVQRRPPGFRQLFGGQQVARDGPNQVMSVAGQRSLRGETGRRGQVTDQPPEPRRGQRGMHVDPRQVRGPVTERRIQVGGGRG